MFPGGNKGMQDLMKQAQKMQQQLLKAQEEVAASEVEASAGGGMVKVVMTGKYELKSIKLDKEAVDPEDTEMLEDLIMAAINEAHNKVAKLSEDNLGNLTGGMKIPGLF